MALASWQLSQEALLTSRARCTALTIIAQAEEQEDKGSRTLIQFLQLCRSSRVLTVLSLNSRSNTISSCDRWLRPTNARETKPSKSGKCVAFIGSPRKRRRREGLPQMAKGKMVGLRASLRVVLDLPGQEVLARQIGPNHQKTRRRTKISKRGC